MRNDVHNPRSSSRCNIWLSEPSRRRRALVWAILPIVIVGVAAVLGAPSLVRGARGWTVTPVSPMTSPPPGMPPAIQNLDGDATTYAAGDPPVGLDRAAPAQVTDDDAGFAGGEVRASIEAGGVAGEDVLGLKTSGAVSLSAGMTPGSVVSLYGTPVGVLTSAGSAGADLVVALNPYGGPVVASMLLQAITYANTDPIAPTARDRYITLTVSDGQDGTSTPAVVRVRVTSTLTESVYLPLALNGYAGR